MAPSSSASHSSAGIGFCGLLTILFIALKLTGVIAWSWLWVLAPLWLPAVVGLVLCFLGLCLVGFCYWSDTRK